MANIFVLIKKQGDSMKKLLFLGALAALATGCSSGSSGSGSSSTFSISGEMGGLSAASIQSKPLTFIDRLKFGAASVVGAISKGGSGLGDGAVSALSNECADGNFYRVLCTSWSVPPVAAYGDVVCNGANSGSFTVSGLPVDTEISCFVRKSTDGTEFEPFATLELPSVGLGGSTDVIEANGNLALSIQVNSSGDLTVEVTGGDNKGDDNVGGSTDTTMSGFWALSCDASGNTAEQNGRCKCFLGDTESAYPGAPNGSKDACLADNGAAITSTQNMVIDLNIYNATVNSSQDFDSDGKNELTAGQTIQGVSVWQASCSGSCTSARGAGGEGLTNLGGALTWASTQATDAIAWSTGVGQTLVTSGGDITGCSAGANDPSGVADCTADLVTPPVVTANRTAWLTWYTNLAKSSNWACNFWDFTSGSGGSASTIAASALDTKAYCMAEFTHRVYERARDTNFLLPRVRFNPCPNGTCVAGAATAAMIEIEGLNFNGTLGTSTPVAGDTIGFGPSQRFVFEQWFPFSNGGGGFRQRHEDRRFFPCIGSGTTGQNGIVGCPSANTFGVECGIKEELNLKMIPTATTGVVNMGFNTTDTVTRAFIRSSDTNEEGKEKVGSFDAYSVCKSILGTESNTFVAKGTKQ